MVKPNISKVAGWDVIERQDGKFGVYDADGMKQGPFDTQAEAERAAAATPRR